MAYIRPNIAYVVSVVSQFMHDLMVQHLWVVNQIMHYLKTTLRRRVLFKKGGNLSNGMYIDVDHAKLVVDRSTTSDYCIFLGGNLII